MGNQLRKPSLCAGGRHAQQEDSFLDAKLAEVIKAKAAKRGPRTTSFNRLLLQFAHLHKGFDQCRQVFHSLDSDGNNVIDLSELRAGVRQLGFGVEDDLVVHIFDAADLDHNQVVDFREFIVVLAILFEFEGEHHNSLPKDIADTFSTAEEAFLYFDSSKKGHMNRKEVMKELGEGSNSPTDRKGKRRSSRSTIQRRFEEMDWDKNGQISFKEWLYAIQNWVLDEDEDE